MDAAGGREVVAGGEASASGWWLGAGAPAVKTAREPAGRQVARGGIAEEGRLDSVAVHWFGLAGSGRKDWLVEIRGSVHLLCEMHPCVCIYIVHFVASHKISYLHSASWIPGVLMTNELSSNWVQQQQLACDITAVINRVVLLLPVPQSSWFNAAYGARY